VRGESGGAESASGPVDYANAADTPAIASITARSALKVVHGRGKTLGSFVGLAQQAVMAGLNITPTTPSRKAGTFDRGRTRQLKRSDTKANGRG
jgi:hypothetical protein